MIRLLSCLLVALLLVGPVAAQGDDLTETYTSYDGSLSFNYPAGWIAWGYGSDYGYIANSEGAHNIINHNEQLTSGQVVISIHGIPYAGPEEVVTLEEIADSMQAGYGTNPLGNQYDITVELIQDPTILSDLNAVESTFVRQGRGVTEEVLSMTRLNGETGIFEITMTAPPGETAQYHDLLLSIVATAQYTPPQAGGLVIPGGGPAAVAGSGDVLWKQERLWGSEADNFRGVASLSVSADDLIYVAEEVGVRVLDKDGNLLRTVTNTEINHFDDVEVAEDGSLWVVNSYANAAYHLDAQGNLLAQLGKQGTEPGQFADTSPTQIELGPDGNLYIANSRAGEHGPAGSIIVYGQNGEFIREFPTDTNPNDMAVLFGFVQLAIAPDGTIYAGDLYTPAIYAFALDGTLLKDNIGAQTVMGILNIAVGNDGSIYAAASFMDSVIYKFDASGNLISQYNITGDVLFIAGLGVLSDNSVIVSGISSRQDASVVLRLAAH